MKFGKYLAARQLELPEYSQYFINYKSLKKVINALISKNATNLNGTTITSSMKSSFFFKLERELEKVNDFYLEKESELKLRLDILIRRKDQVLSNPTASSLQSLYQNYKSFAKDLERLQQFVELNELGFTKVLKKWDKRSKSTTKELYLTTAVNVQPVFHRFIIIELSDLVTNTLIDLENRVENFIESDSTSTNPNTASSTSNTNGVSSSNNNGTSIDRRFSAISFESSSLDSSHDLEVQTYYNLLLDVTLIDRLNDLISNKPNSTILISKLFLYLLTESKDNLYLIKFIQKFQSKIDLCYVDEINRMSCFHLLCKREESKETLDLWKLILEIGQHNQLKDNVIKSLVLTDLNGKNVVHHLVYSNNLTILTLIINFVNQLGESNCLITLLTSKDNKSLNPLLTSIIKNNPVIIDLLLANGANAFPEQDDYNPIYLPINMACKFGFKESLLCLLQFNKNNNKHENLLTNPKKSANAEGLLPIHIAANNNHVELIPILLEFGANINQVDRLNKWTPIFYSVVNGFVEMTQLLIKNNADISIKDEDNLSPLFYSIWEGNINILNELIISEMTHLTHNNNTNTSVDEVTMNSTTVDDMTTSDLLAPPISTALLGPSDPANIEELPPLDGGSGVESGNNGYMNMNPNDIPDLSLPPPIIPLRKYGHNFLEKKIFLKLTFFTNRNSIKLNYNDLHSLPGRITINFNKNDIIPRNLLLPILDNNKSIIFQIDDLQNFKIEFELYPTFGTKLIAKTTLSNTQLSSLYLSGYGSKLNGDLELNLYDSRLRYIGDLKFNYEIIFPYSGVPLEISLYETYWKSSNSATTPTHDVSHTPETTSLVSYVTASSLSGKYLNVLVCFLNNGEPIVVPNPQIKINGVNLPVCSVNLKELNSIVYPNLEELNGLKNQLLALKSIDNNNDFDQLTNILSQLYVPLSDFLNLLSPIISINLEIFYPTEYEMEYCDLLKFSICSSSKDVLSNCHEHSLNSATNNLLNNFIDLILSNIFNHVRALRNESLHNRSIILSSNNSNVCNIINWKQPNFPVFYNMNGVNFNNETQKFIPCTAYGFQKIAEADPIASTSITVSPEDQLNVENMDSINKNFTPYESDLLNKDKLTRSIKLALDFINMNNLLGLIIPIRLLTLSPELIEKIRSSGVILVGSSESGQSTTNNDEFINHTHNSSHINGLKKDKLLVFNNSINV